MNAEQRAENLRRMQELETRGEARGLPGLWAHLLSPETLRRAVSAEVAAARSMYHEAFPNAK